MYSGIRILAHQMAFSISDSKCHLFLLAVVMYLVCNITVSKLVTFRQYFALSINSKTNVYVLSNFNVCAIFTFTQ